MSHGKYENGRRGRRAPARKERATFLIVCEGARTEPHYFEGFRVRVEDADIFGKGYNTLSLVQETITIRENSHKAYDQVWCVFDRDDFPVENFNRALELAAQNDIRVAYSNQAFEIWYLLHFHFHNAAIHRDQYAEKLGKELKRPYKKNDREIFTILRGKRTDAIRNARQLYESYTPHLPATDNPCTTVYLLVEELIKNLPGQP
ncbi:RloB-like protein [Abditibacterium utsteinense]|uniref:RloB-like protein n=1 Tax=Abditibacterium utsteinense TaxID=1960156 RepID=A0A2S8STF8_9BACT|nr:RloB family protein [Abditibacterium utsteinense]PQV64085.1 RloB-like protein [Abditibacterium utsteinense]